MFPTFFCETKLFTMKLLCDSCEIIVFQKDFSRRQTKTTLTKLG
jgi:hypothetical protein